MDARASPRHVHQRPPRIAWVNRRIRLNKRLELAIGNNVAPLRRHYAGGYSLLQPEWTADRQHPVANLHAVGVAQFRRRERMIDLNLDHGQVGLLIHADQLRIVAGRSRIFILQLPPNAICLFDDVTVGDDVALGIHNDAGTKRPLADGARVRASLTALTTEELVKEILKLVVVLAALILVRVRTDVRIAPFMRALNRRLGIDIYYARLQLLGNLGEGIRELLRSGYGQGSRIRRLLSFLAFNSIGNNRANQNSNRQRGQNRKSVGPTVGFETGPKSAFAQIHFYPPETA